MNEENVQKSSGDSAINNRDYDGHKPFIWVSVLRFLLYYIVLIPIFTAAGFLYFDLKVDGRKNLKGMRRAILVSNHVHYADSGMVGCAVFPRRVTVVSHIGNFSLPFYGWFVRQANCIPIGETYSQHRIFLQLCTEKLARDKLLAIFPEGKLNLYSRLLHPFTMGAFILAAQTGTPVVPCVFSLRPVTGIRKLWCRKPFFSLHIGTPIYPENSGSIKSRAALLSEITFTYFQNELNRF